MYGLWVLDGWDIAQQQFINYLKFGGLVLSILVFARKYERDIPTWLFFGFGIFSLSPIAIENHTWGFQTQWHLVLLFLIWAVILLFDSRQRALDLAVGP